MIKTTENLIKFLVLVGAASYGAICFNKIKKQAELNKRKSNELKTDRFDENKSVNLDTFTEDDESCMDKEFNSLDYIGKIHRLVTTNVNIDMDDLEYEDNYFEEGHHMRVERAGDLLQLRIEIPAKESRNYLEEANVILARFKEDTGLNPRILKEGFLIEESEDNRDWTNINFEKFSDLVKQARDREDIKLFMRIDFRIDRVNPKSIAKLIEDLLHNEGYEEKGIYFGPVVFVKDGDEM